MPLVADRPKPMLDVRGKTILERQVAMLRSCGVNDISVVRGYKKDSVAIPGIRYFDNDNFAESGEVASLFTAEKALKGRVLVLYGDVIMERSVIEKVIAAKADIAVSVDASFGREAHAHGNGNGNGHPHDGKAEGKTKTDLVKLAEAPPPILPRGRFVSEEGTTVPVTAIGRTLKEAHGEFSGILGLTSRGTDLVKKAYEQAKAAGLEAKFHESPSLRKAAMTDLVQELVRSKADVRGVLHWKGWMEVDSFDDYRRAWATTTS
jgi:phosphoenolpyruvate phosphomutase